MRKLENISMQNQKGNEKGQGTFKKLMKLNDDFCGDIKQLYKEKNEIQNQLYKKECEY